MTLKQLLSVDASILEAMSDKQIEEFFASSLNITRPELAGKAQTKSQKKSSANKSLSQKAKIARASAIATELGVTDFEELFED